MDTMLTNRLARATAVLMAGCVLVSATPVLAGTPLENHQKRIGKSAAPGTGIPERPKGTCVCQQIGNNALGRAGFLRQLPPSGADSGLDVDCVVPRFNATTGDETGLSSCQIFVPLPK